MDIAERKKQLELNLAGKLSPWTTPRSSPRHQPVVQENEVSFDRLNDIILQKTADSRTKRSRTPAKLNFDNDDDESVDADDSSPTHNISRKATIVPTAVKQLTAINETATAKETKSTSEKLDSVSEETKIEEVKTDSRPKEVKVENKPEEPKQSETVSPKEKVIIPSKDQKKEYVITVSKPKESLDEDNRYEESEKSQAQKDENLDSKVPTGEDKDKQPQGNKESSSILRETVTTKVEPSIPSEKIINKKEQSITEESKQGNVPKDEGLKQETVQEGVVLAQEIHAKDSANKLDKAPQDKLSSGEGSSTNQTPPKLAEEKLELKADTTIEIESSAKQSSTNLETTTESKIEEKKSSNQKPDSESGVTEHLDTKENINKHIQAESNLHKKTEEALRTEPVRDESQNAEIKHDLSPTVESDKKTVLDTHIAASENRSHDNIESVKKDDNSKNETKSLPAAISTDKHIKSEPKAIIGTPKNIQNEKNIVSPNVSINDHNQMSIEKKLEPQKLEESKKANQEQTIQGETVKQDKLSLKSEMKAATETPKKTQKEEDILSPKVTTNDHNQISLEKKSEPQKLEEMKEESSKIDQEQKIQGKTVKQDTVSEAHSLKVQIHGEGEQNSQKQNETPEKAVLSVDESIRDLKPQENQKIIVERVPRSSLSDNQASQKIPPAKEITEAKAPRKSELLSHSNIDKLKEDKDNQSKEAPRIEKKETHAQKEQRAEAEIKTNSYTLEVPGLNQTRKSISTPAEKLNQDSAKQAVKSTYPIIQINSEEEKSKIRISQTPSSQPRTSYMGTGGYLSPSKISHAHEESKSLNNLDPQDHKPKPRVSFAEGEISQLTPQSKGSSYISTLSIADTNQRPSFFKIDQEKRDNKKTDTFGSVNPRPSILGNEIKKESKDPKSEQPSRRNSIKTEAQTTNSKSLAGSKENPQGKVKKPVVKKIAPKPEWVGVRAGSAGKSKAKPSNSANKKAKKESEDDKKKSLKQSAFEKLQTGDLLKLPFYERFQYQKSIADYKIEKQRMEQRIHFEEEESKTLTFHPNLNREHYRLPRFGDFEEDLDAQKFSSPLRSPKRIRSKSPEFNSIPEQKANPVVNATNQFLKDKYLRSTSPDVYERLKAEGPRSPKPRSKTPSKAETYTHKPIINKNSEELSIRKRTKELIFQSILDDSLPKEKNQLKTPTRSKSPEFEKASGIKNAQPTAQLAKSYQLQRRRGTDPVGPANTLIPDKTYLKMLIEAKQTFVDETFEDPGPIIETKATRLNNSPQADQKDLVMNKIKNSDPLKIQSIRKEMPQDPVEIKPESVNKTSDESESRVETKAGRMNNNQAANLKDNKESKTNPLKAQSRGKETSKALVKGKKTPANKVQEEPVTKVEFKPTRTSSAQYSNQNDLWLNKASNVSPVKAQNNEKETSKVPVEIKQKTVNKKPEEPEPKVETKAKRTNDSQRSDQNDTLNNTRVEKSTRTNSAQYSNQSEVLFNKISNASPAKGQSSEKESPKVPEIKQTIVNKTIEEPVARVEVKSTRTDSPQYSNQKEVTINKMSNLSPAKGQSSGKESPKVPEIKQTMVTKTIEEPASKVEVKSTRTNSPQYSNQKEFTINKMSNASPAKGQSSGKESPKVPEIKQTIMNKAIEEPVTRVEIKSTRTNSPQYSNRKEVMINKMSNVSPVKGQSDEKESPKILEIKQTIVNKTREEPVTRVEVKSTRTDSPQYLNRKEVTINRMNNASPVKGQNDGKESPKVPEIKQTIVNKTIEEPVTRLEVKSTRTNSPQYSNRKEAMANKMTNGSPARAQNSGKETPKVSTEIKQTITNKTIEEPDRKVETKVSRTSDIQRSDQNDLMSDIMYNASPVKVQSDVKETPKVPALNLKSADIINKYLVFKQKK